MVAFVDAQGSLMFAQERGETWTSGQVAAGGALGVSMVAGQDLPVLAFYQKDGTVQVASESRSQPVLVPSKWTLVKAGQSSPPAATGAQAGASTTGVATDDNGNVWVTWADLATKRIMLASAKVGSQSFKAQALPQSQGGWSPNLAVAGKAVAVAWYDSVGHRLDVSTSASAAPELIAVPSPLFSPLPSPTGTAPPCLPPSASTTSASISAQNIAFNINCLAVVPEKPFTVAFDNADTSPHNFAIYTDSSATKLLGGAKSPSEIVAAGAKVTYDVSPLKPGIYFFRCDIHPTQMTGTFVVEPPGKGGSPSPTPTPTPSPSST
jgi:plastocyanin